MLFDTSIIFCYLYFYEHCNQFIYFVIVYVCCIQFVTRSLEFLEKYVAAKVDFNKCHSCMFALKQIGMVYVYI